jgi:hypothetical protein
MLHCEHCETLVTEMKDVRTTVEHLVAEMSATRAVMETMQKSLLGNGQPGRCALHSERIARLERWRSWLTGALAVLGILWTATVTVFAAVVAERIKR